MQEDIIKELEELKSRSNHLDTFLRLSEKRKRLKELEQIMAQEDFWNDKDKADQVIKEVQQLKSVIRPSDAIVQRIDSALSMAPDIQELGDEALMKDLVEECEKINFDLDALEVQRMLSHPLDPNNCYLKINAGAGGTESCDWVQMLARMYERWAQRRGFKLEVLEALDGDVAGLKSILYKISGPFAYGYTKGEGGVHRLVRLSPYDSAGKRHTSFASVEVTPEISDSIEVDIKPEDLRTDTFRAQGAGGQHVNVTDSAVRITHIPSKIVVSCQSERSQRQNRETCLSLLKSMLYEKEMLEREKSIENIVGDKKKIEWGSQIRSYVLHPYSLVTDLRTKMKVTKVQAVLDGDIDALVIGFLKYKGYHESK